MFQPDKTEGKEAAKTGADGLCVWEHSGVAESPTERCKESLFIGRLHMPSTDNRMPGEETEVSMVTT